ncbi:MAG: YiaA/YiaB family inner membrane protein [Pseudomonadota bacterium]
MTPHQLNSPAWIFFCYASFGIAIGTTAIGIWSMEVSMTMKGFLFMGLLFTTGSAFTLAKTLRDEHEASRFHNRIEEARTERLLRDVDAA